MTESGIPLHQLACSSESFFTVFMMVGSFMPSFSVHSRIPSRLETFKIQSAVKDCVSPLLTKVRYLYLTASERDHIVSTAFASMDSELPSTFRWLSSLCGSYQAANSASESLLFRLVQTIQALETISYSKTNHAHSLTKPTFAYDL